MLIKLINIFVCYEKFGNVNVHKLSKTQSVFNTCQMKLYSKLRKNPIIQHFSSIWVIGIIQQPCIAMVIPNLWNLYYVMHAHAHWFYSWWYLRPKIPLNVIKNIKICPKFWFLLCAEPGLAFLVLVWHPQSAATKLHPKLLVQTTKIPGVS